MRAQNPVRVERGQRGVDVSGVRRAVQRPAPGDDVVAYGVEVVGGDELYVGDLRRGDQVDNGIRVATIDRIGHAGDLTAESKPATQRDNSVIQTRRFVGVQLDRRVERHRRVRRRGWRAGRTLDEVGKDCTRFHRGQLMGIALSLIHI